MKMSWYPLLPFALMVAVTIGFMAWGLAYS